MTKEKKIEELTKFLKDKAKALRSDWEDVPLWVIDASIEWMKSKEPTKRAKQLEIADRFLSAASEKTTAEMVDLIEAAMENDQCNDLIDTIEGVEVAEAFEYSFTVESFLLEINS